MELFVFIRGCPLCRQSWGLYTKCSRCGKDIRLLFSPFDSEEFKKEMRKRVKQQQALGNKCLHCKEEIPQGHRGLLIFCKEGEVIVCPHCEAPVGKYIFDDGRIYVVSI